MSALRPHSTLVQRRAHLFETERCLPGVGRALRCFLRTWRPVSHRGRHNPMRLIALLFTAFLAVPPASAQEPPASPAQPPASAAKDTTPAAQAAKPLNA